MTNAKAVAIPGNFEHANIQAETIDYDARIKQLMTRLHTLTSGNAPHILSDFSCGSFKKNKAVISAKVNVQRDAPKKGFMSKLFGPNEDYLVFELAFGLHEVTLDIDSIFTTIKNYDEGTVLGYDAIISAVLMNFHELSNSFKANFNALFRTNFSQARVRIAHEKMKLFVDKLFGILPAPYNGMKLLDKDKDLLNGVYTKEGKDRALSINIGHSHASAAHELDPIKPIVIILRVMNGADAALKDALKKNKETINSYAQLTFKRSNTHTNIEIVIS